jgi:hypothetical protein
MTKGLARDRHAKLLTMIGMEMGTREVTGTTTPSSFEDNPLTQQRDGRHSIAATSGSDELYGSHAVQPSDMDAR